MTASGRFWMKDRLRHSITQMETCRTDILQRLQEENMDDDMRKDQEIEADIYTKAIEHEKRLLQQMEEGGDENA